MIWLAVVRGPAVAAAICFGSTFVYFLCPPVCCCHQVVNLDAVPGVVDESGVSKSAENLQLGMSAAQSIGAVLGGITAADIENGDPMKTMDLIWAVMKLEVLKGLDIPKLVNKVC